MVEKEKVGDVGRVAVARRDEEEKVIDVVLEKARAP